MAEAALADMKAVDVRVIDVRGFNDIADFMVLASGTSDRHLRAIAELHLVVLGVDQAAVFGAVDAVRPVVGLCDHRAEGGAAEGQVHLVADLLQTRLFERGKHGVELTPAGVRFMRYAGPCVQALREGIGSLRGGGRSLFDTLLLC